jgi:hypothetical protein
LCWGKLYLAIYFHFNPFKFSFSLVINPVKTKFAISFTNFYT